jgi:hypothetical protein
MEGNAMIRNTAMAAAILAFSTVASAATRLDLSTLDKGMTGTRAQVLTLGMVHLSEQSTPVKPAALASLLDKLAAFKPQIITIEAIPGEECDMVARFSAIYGSDFCNDAKAGATATGLDVPAATAEANKLLQDWPAQPTPAQRRRLAALFFAANESASAYVQWLQLPDAERHAGDSLDDTLVQALQKLGTRSDENIQIAAALAARLGLPRVNPIDDHTGDNINVTDEKAFGHDLQAAWDKEKPALQAALERQKKLEEASDWLPLYRYVNQPDQLNALARMNVVGAMTSPSPQRYPQVWVGGWETRNLRMIANVRASFRDHPGARVLVIVGASHKPWFDSWLGQMQGVDIVDAVQILK